MTRLIAIAILGMVCAVTGSPTVGQSVDTPLEKPNVPAGPLPNAEDVRELILRRLYDQLRDPDSVKQFRWLVEGKLVSYRTSMPRGTSLEQAWLYCYQYNARNAYGGYVGVRTNMEVVRVLNGRVVFVPRQTWAGGVPAEACEAE